MVKAWLLVVFEPGRWPLINGGSVAPCGWANGSKPWLGEWVKGKTIDIVQRAIPSSCFFAGSLAVAETDIHKSAKRKKTRTTLDNINLTKPKDHCAEKLLQCCKERASIFWKKKKIALDPNIGEAFRHKDLLVL